MKPDLNLIAQIHQEIRAFHEAAHGVVGIVLGLNILAVTIDPIEEVQGKIMVELPADDYIEDRRRLQAHVTYILAGLGGWSLAIKQRGGHFAPEKILSEAIRNEEPDIRAACQAIELLGSRAKPLVGDPELQQALNLTLQLVELLKFEISSVAALLLKQKTLKGEELLAAVASADWPLRRTMARRLVQLDP